jgi:hypothetical protein
MEQITLCRAVVREYLCNQLPDFYYRVKIKYLKNSAKLKNYNVKSRHCIRRKNCFFSNWPGQSFYQKEHLLPVSHIHFFELFNSVFC